MEKITAEKFKERVGVDPDPENDDLARCNCEKAGTVGHFSCGWCKKCDLPVFICGHIKSKEDK